MFAVFQFSSGTSINNMFARITIETVFDVMDIIYYGVGCVLLGIFE